MKGLQSLDWANDPINKLRKGYKSQRASIAHYSASDVAIEEVEFSSGIGLKFIPALLNSDTDILYFHVSTLAGILTECISYSKFSVLYIFIRSEK